MQKQKLKIGIISLAAFVLVVPGSACFADMNEMLTNAKAVPYFENGQLAGYQSVEAQPGAVYQDLSTQKRSALDLSIQNGEAVSVPDSTGN